MSNVDYDLVVVGRGPVGLTLAMSAARLGIRVAVIEKHRDLYGLPRAGHVDHEIMRLFQQFGIVEDVLADCYPTTEYTWVNAHGETLLEFDWGEESVSGYNSDYMQFQPVFEQALGKKLAEAETNTDYLGWQVTDFTQADGNVTVRITETKLAEGSPIPILGEKTQTLTARFMVATDGANSATREALGVVRDDFGFNEKWLVIDGRKKKEMSFDFDCGQICDPKRPITILPLGKRHRRFEWAVLPDEAPESLMTEKAAWELLGEHGLDQDNFEIVRQLVYTFEARHARGWRQGNVFLAGDAAHTMPPFMGQGMCSGMRDAVNLAWKFDLVLRGISEEALLDSYEPERSPHTEDWCKISLEAGKVPCTLDPKEAEERDQKFRDGWLPPMPDFPQLVDGVIAVDTEGKPRKLAGTLSLQSRVKVGPVVDQADNLLGTGFQLVGIGCDPKAALSDRQLADLERIGGRVISIGDHKGADAGDAEGRYAAWAAENGVSAVLVRPDFYIYGVAETLAEAGALVDDMTSKLCLKAPAHA